MGSVTKPLPESTIDLSKTAHDLRGCLFVFEECHEGIQDDILEKDTYRRSFKQAKEKLEKICEMLEGVGEVGAAK
jgi:hypothetical protein